MVTAESTSTIHVIAVPEHEEVATLLVGARPREAAFTADGKRAYVTSEIGSEVAELDLVANRVAKKVKLPGFRKGKVPVAVVRKSFKNELDQEFLETVMPKAFGQALDETGRLRR